MMRIKFSIVALFLTFVGVAGCASGPTYDEYSSTMQPVSSGNGRIYVYRLSALGAGVQPKIRLDGEPVGKAVPKGFFYLDLAPGSYTISASTEAERSLSLSLAAGEEKYVRLEMKMGVFAGHVKPVLVETEVGKEELQKTKYVGEVAGSTS